MRTVFNPTEVIERLQQVNKEVTDSFEVLLPDQLSWKPNPEKWSIRECLQHLITSNETYFPALDKLRISYQPTFWEKRNPFSRSIGKNMVKTLGKSSRRKFKSPPIFLPRKINVTDDIVKAFLNHQEILLNKVRELSSFPWDDIIISSPVSPLITLPLSDCLEVLTGHEERHLMQAQKLTEMANFPKA